jgi:hypothetical protein
MQRNITTDTPARTLPMRPRLHSVSIPDIALRAERASLERRIDCGDADERDRHDLIRILEEQIDRARWPLGEPSPDSGPASCPGCGTLVSA